MRERGRKGDIGREKDRRKKTENKNEWRLASGSLYRLGVYPVFWVFLQSEYELRFWC